MSKYVGFWSLVVVSCVFLFAGSTRADDIDIRVTGSFTSFTGSILGGGQTFFEFCPADACGVIGLPPGWPFPTCPDAGCGTFLGIAHVPFGGNPKQDTANHLSFRVDSQAKNELIFKAARDPNSFILHDVNPGNPFELGTLTFTNGLWTADANFGFSIVAYDLSHSTSHRFDGLIQMALTPNTGTPQQNADFIYITDPAGNPVVSPLTLKALPSIRAYELADSPNGSNSVTVDLFGKFGSLDLTSIENATGGGFIDVSLTSEPGGPPSQVPEPATFALLGCGVLALAALKRGSLSQPNRG
jgi:hypothetical protein